MLQGLSLQTPSAPAPYWTVAGVVDWKTTKPSVLHLWPQGWRDSGNGAGLLPFHPMTRCSLGVKTRVFVCSKTTSEVSTVKNSPAASLVGSTEEHPTVLTLSSAPESGKGPWLRPSYTRQQLPENQPQKLTLLGVESVVLAPPGHPKPPLHRPLTDTLTLSVLCRLSSQLPPV